MINVIICILAFILGACFASFFGVVCYRVPKGMSISNPPSHCECGDEIKWYNNIPIISYIILGGKCKKCGAKIGFSSFACEVIGALSMLFIGLLDISIYEKIFLFLITLIMLLMAMYDFYTNTIIDIFWIIFLCLSIGYYFFKVFYLNTPYYEGLIACVISVAFFIIIKLIFYLFTKQDCLGTGDVIVMGVAGLILNYKTLLVAILVGTLFGSILELILIATKVKDREKPIPFLPYLCFGLYISLLYGEKIIGLYKELLDAILFM